MKACLLFTSLVAFALVGCASATPTPAATTHAHFSPSPTVSVATTEISSATTTTPTTARTIADDGVSVEVAGFVAHLSKSAQRHPQRHATLKAFATRLAAITATFPASAHDDLKHTPIYFTERKDPSSSSSSSSSSSQGPLFHPATEGGELANAIEVPSIGVLAEQLDSESPKAMSTLTTILAAGYFMHLSAPPWREAEDAFNRAKTNLVTAKLGTDALSYFSALSAEYFGRCSLPPDREALRSADPRGVALITRTWLTPTRMAAR